MEDKILELIALDRLDITFSSLDNKLRRGRMSQAGEILTELGKRKSFSGDRTYIKLANEDKNLARGMKEAIKEFVEQHPKYGKILEGKIAEKRVRREQHLYFGMNQGSKLGGQEYMKVLTDLGISEHRAHVLYPIIIDISRNLERKGKDRSVIVGKYDL